MSKLAKRAVKAEATPTTTIYSPKVLKPSLSGASLTLRNM